MDEPAQLQRSVPWWVARAIADPTAMRTLWCVGGLGAAKSHGSQVWDLYRCLQNGVPACDPKPSVSWTVAPNYRICETLLELTLQVAQDVFDMTEGRDFELRRSFPREISFLKSGRNHRMALLSASNPEHFVSASITHWRWSEVGVSKAVTLEKLADRLRDKRAVVLQGLGDGSPEGYNHFYDWAGFVGSRREVVDADRNVRVFRVETGDNIHNLAPGYLEALRARYAYNPALLDSYELGLFRDFRVTNAAYWSFTESRGVCDAVTPSPYLPVHFCWDFNVSPLAWVALQTFTAQRDYYSPRVRRTIALHESTGDSRGLYEGCLEFAVRFPVAQFRNTPIMVDGDCSGWAGSWKVSTDDYTAIEEYLRTMGYRNVTVIAPKSNPEIRVRLEKVNALFAYDMVAVSPTCPRLIGGLARTALKQGTWKIDKPSGEDWSHYPDAFGYGLMGLYGDQEITNPNAGGKTTGGVF